MYVSTQTLPQIFLYMSATCYESFKSFGEVGKMFFFSNSYVRYHMVTTGVKWLMRRLLQSIKCWVINILSPLAHRLHRTIAANLLLTLTWPSRALPSGAWNQRILRVSRLIPSSQHRIQVLKRPQQHTHQFGYPSHQLIFLQKIRQKQSWSGDWLGHLQPAQCFSYFHFFIGILSD